MWSKLVLEPTNTEGGGLQIHWTYVNLIRQLSQKKVGKPASWDRSMELGLSESLWCVDVLAVFPTEWGGFWHFLRFFNILTDFPL